MPSLSILLPTRRRVDVAERMLRTLVETAVHPERIEVVMTAELDDPPMRNLQIPGLVLRKVIAPPMQIGAAYRRCWNLSSGQCLLFANDGLAFESFGWDRVVSQSLTDAPDGIALLWSRDDRSTRPTHLFLPRRVGDLLGSAGIDSYRRSHVTAHVYDVFRQLAARGHERRRCLPDTRITCSTETGTPDFHATRQQQSDERTYIAWSEERRWLALDLERAIHESRATPALRRAA